MPQLDSDAFTYSNGNLATVSSAKWTKDTAFADPVVTSNQLNAAFDTDAAARISSWSGSTADHYSEAVLATDGGDNGGPCVRSDGAGTFYCVGTIAGAIRIFEVTAGSFASIAGPTGAYAEGDTIRISAVGTTITVYANGVQQAQVTDGTITTGRPGMTPFSNAGKWDNWAAGDFAAAGGGSTKGPTLPLTGVQ